MLNQYLTQTEQLLQNPPSPTSLYSTANLTQFINTARGQLAGDGQCIRSFANFATVANQNSLAFTSATGLAASISGIFHVRMLSLNGVGLALNTWPWEYFQQYFFTSGVSPAAPSDWAQYNQGAAGSLFFNPTPDKVYTFVADTCCFPIPLSDDTTAEAIPYPWTDAVPYFAAYLALMSSQSSARLEQAKMLLQLYNEFKDRARRYSTPDVLPYQYEQTGIGTAVPMAQAQPARGANA